MDRVTKIHQRINSVMKDINGDCRQLVQTEQDQKKYLLEKCAVLEEIIVELTGKRPQYNDNQKRRICRFAKSLNEFLLSEIETTFAPGTILYQWTPELIGAKYDSTKSPNQKKRGRKRISQEIVDEVLLLNKNNPDWGYDKIAGTMRYLGYDVCASTVRNILNDFGIIPDPERKRTGDWMQFIETQQYLTAATDFAHKEIITPYGLQRESMLFFMDIGGREVRLGGMTVNPDSNWTTQVARNMCDMWDGFMLGKKYLIRDRDPVFNKRFDSIFESIGVEIKRLPPFTPQMNARMENFIRALKTECLDKIIVRSEAELRIAVTEYLEYWNHFRPHEGLGGQIPVPLKQDMNAPVKEVSFLGGLLHGYYRQPLAA